MLIYVFCVHVGSIRCTICASFRSCLGHFALADMKNCCVLSAMLALRTNIKFSFPILAECWFVNVQDARDSEGNPIDAAFYQTFWGLQHAFQHPVETLHPDNWTKMVKDVKLVLAEFMKRPVAVSGRAPSAGTGYIAASRPLLCSCVPLGKGHRQPCEIVMS